MRKPKAGDIFLDIFVYGIMAVMLIAIAYPFYYAIIISLNNGLDAARGGIFLWPRVFTLDNYKIVFSNDALLSSYIITISRTVIGTVVSVLFTGIFAYSLAQKKLFFKKTYTMILLISMLFTGGLIPYFILLKNLHLFNTFWVYIIPSMLDGFNTILMISFFRELPESLQESAKIDGANDLVIFFRIIIPVSTPIFATIALFNGVYHWNDWFTTAYFAPDQKLKTVAYMLYELIEKSDIAAIMRTSGAVAASKAVEAHTYTAETIRMSTTFVVVIPIMCIYPFLQKYFVKGIMLGSIKA